MCTPSSHMNRGHAFIILLSIIVEILNFQQQKLII